MEKPPIEENDRATDQALYQYWRQCLDRTDPGSSKYPDSYYF